jgi:enoyl-CoA hydratase/carnithine racemase
VIQFEKEDTLGIITINRPEVYNCLNFATLLQLRKLAEEIAIDRQLRAIIVTGAGDKAFCTGADLKERRTLSDAEVTRYIYTIRDTFTQIERLPKPVIAAINGVAFGGGLELALACDIRIMCDEAQVGLTETSLGIIPGAGGTQRLTRLVGKGKAKELIFTARRIGADEALAIGLVNAVATRDELMKKARELAAEIAQNAPLAIAQAKFAIDFGLEADLATGLAIESNAYQVLIPTKDRLEGLNAFKEKRKPIYRGE